MDISKIRVREQTAIDATRAILEILSKKEYQLPPPNAVLAAQQLAANQSDNHKRVMRDVFKAYSGAQSTNDYDLAHFIEGYIDRLNPTSQCRVVGGKDESYWVISEHVPVLDDKLSNRIKNIFSNLQGISPIEVADLFVTAYLLRTKTSAARDILQSVGPQAIRVISAISRLESVIVATEEQTAKKSRLLEDAAEAVDQARSLYAEKSTALETELATLAERVTQANERAKIVVEKSSALELAVEEGTASIQSATLDFKDRFASSDQHAKAFMESVRAEANFEDLKIHWSDRGNAASRSTVISNCILIFLLAIIPSIAIYNSDSVANFVHKLTSAATVNIGENPDGVAVAVSTVSRLIIITIPIALYFWLIRLVVRFNMRSMLLMDDARQRATMLETYYRMIERNAATVQDRALVLQALLRPAPGHGADTVEPPNFAEVIDKAMGKGS